jgi:hypothetical protein
MHKLTSFFSCIMGGAWCEVEHRHRQTGKQFVFVSCRGASSVESPCVRVRVRCALRRGVARTKVTTNKPGDETLAASASGKVFAVRCQHVVCPARERRRET